MRYQINSKGIVMPTFLFEIISMIASGITVSAGFSFLLLQNKKNKAKQENSDDLSSKIENASKHLLTASEELSSLHIELSNRIKIVNQLKEDAKIAENIVSLNKDQVEAIKSSLNIELKKDSRRNFWISFSIGLFFFILGAVASYIISKFF